VKCGGLLAAREKVDDDKYNGVSFVKVFLCAARRVKPSPAPSCGPFVAITLVVIVVSQPAPHLGCPPETVHVQNLNSDAGIKCEEKE